MAFGSPQKVVLIGEETTWGTAVSATKDIGIIKDITHNNTHELIPTMGAGNIETQQVSQGHKEGSVDITMDFQHGRILEYTLGTVAHATETSDEKHTFTIADLPKSITVEDSDNSTADITNKLSGGYVENCVFSYSINNNLECKTTLKGKNEDIGTSASAAAVSSLPVFPSTQIHFSINSVEATTVQEASLTIQKKVEIIPGAGSVDPQDGHPVEMKFLFSGKIAISTTAYYALIDGTTSFPVLLNAHNAIAAGSGRRELYFALQDCFFNKLEKVATVGSITYLNFEGEGLFNTAYTYDNIASGSW